MLSERHPKSPEISSFPTLPMMPGEMRSPEKGNSCQAGSSKVADNDYAGQQPILSERHPKSPEISPCPTLPMMPGGIIMNLKPPASHHKPGKQRKVKLEDVGEDVNKLERAKKAKRTAKAVRRCGRKKKGEESK